MPRRNRCLLPEAPCHITQRGVDRREVFSSDQDRTTYLRLVQENLHDAGARILGYCLMSNHVHLIAVPAQEESLSILFRRVHARYAQYYNARFGRSGHLWQNRFFSCMLCLSHLWFTLAYVERNPVRAGMVKHAADYHWSSAKAHSIHTKYKIHFNRQMRIENREAHKVRCGIVISWFRSRRQMFEEACKI